MKHAADITVGTAGCKGAFTAFVLDAEIPASLRKGALRAPGAQLNFDKDTLSLVIYGAWAPLRVNATGHYILSMAEFGSGPNLAASYFERSFLEKRPDLSDGVTHLPLADSGLLRFASTKNFRPVRQ